MKNVDLRKYWTSLLRWKGWKAFGSGCVKLWRAALSWGGWKLLFCLPFPLLLLLSAGCGGGLVWVFSQGLENWVPSCFLYALSAYCLTALCVQLPGFLRDGKSWIASHPKLVSLLQNDQLHSTLSLYWDQLLNFLYGSFKIASGVVLGSAWIGCDGIYTMTQALIQLHQILSRKKARTLTQQWRSYRSCGVLILLMHLTLTGIVFQMVNWNRAVEKGEIQVISTAVFAFCKITTSFISIARDRKHLQPVESSIRMLNLAQAIFAIFSLQASMFHTFGTGESWEQLLNIITGCTVCLLILSMGIYMIRRANRELKKREEMPYGQS